MIYIHQSGGFGNTLFKYITAKIIAKKYKKKYFILPNEKNFKSNLFILLTYHILIFFKLKKKTKQTISFNILNVYEKQNNFLNYIKIISNYFCYNKLKKVNHKNEIPEQITKNMLLKFTFNFKEILDNRDDVVNWLIEPQFVKNKIKRFKEYHNINFENCCAVHVRRGDYLITDKGYGSKNGWALPKKYYELCFSKLPKDVIYIFFTDDKAYVKKEFYNVSNKLISEYDEITDLYLISKCKYKILANSTFSLWGGFLGNLDKDVVYAPKYLIGCYKKKWYPFDISNLFKKWNYEIINDE